MGLIQLPTGKGCTSMYGQLKTPFVATFVVLFVVWSLLSMHPSSLRTSPILNTDLSSAASEQNARPEWTSDISTPESEVISFPDNTASDRPLILYAYADSEKGISLENLKFFIQHGLHDAADFIFILNGETNAKDVIPHHESNIRIVQRPNDCYDIGAYAEVLTKNDLYKRYKKFIMMNASLRGPFMPYWANSCWSDMYLSKVTDEVKLVGMTANCWPTFHIQSMIWATDRIGLETLLFPPQNALDFLAENPVTLPPPRNKEKEMKNKVKGKYRTAPQTTSTETTDAAAPENTTIHQAPGINACFHNWDSAVAAEVSSTALIKAAGYKVDAMMAAYHGMKEYADEQKSCDENKDVLFDKEYFGTNVGVFETGFAKANRDVNPVDIKRQTEWMQGRAYRSYDYCHAPVKELA